MALPLDFIWITRFSLTLKNLSLTKNGQEIQTPQSYARLLGRKTEGAPEERETTEEKVTRKHKLLLFAVINEELDPTKPLKKELQRVKDRIAEQIGSESIMVQDVS